MGPREKIWGLASPDNLADPASPDAMTDIELIYWHDSKDYSLEVETIYEFRGRKETAQYLRILLDEFTVWMEENGYDTHTPPSLYRLFKQHGQRYKTIAGAYAHFRVTALGYIAAVEEETHYERSK